ncbi:unnamed protein product [Chrysoparadoxa australica]
MSRGLTQPVTQVRLTNVAVVRVTRCGKRFEVACYRNKVVNWRNHVETDMDEVLQIDNVFHNVSKGILANKKDMVKAFGTADKLVVIKHILDKGELQVSDKERQEKYESMFRDVATIICEKCVDPTSNRPYTISMIENAMKEVHFSVHPTKNAKAQALELVEKLKTVMPIARALMKLRITAPAAASSVAVLREELRALRINQVVREVTDDQECSLDFLVEPGLYREVEELMNAQTNGAGQLLVLELNVHEEGEADIDLETARKGVLAMQAPSSSSPRHEVAREKGKGSQAAEVESAGSREKKGKKSKKAKRREKEAAAEREAYAQKESMRRAERKERDAGLGVAAAGGEAEAEKPSKPLPQEGGQVKKLTCTTCAGATFTKTHREHFKTDWHRCNLKRKSKGLPVLSYQQFEAEETDHLFWADSCYDS